MKQVEWDDTLWSRWPTWRLVVEEQPGTIEEKVARDQAVGRKVAAGGPPTFRLWVNDPCLVVSRRDIVQGLRRGGDPPREVDGLPIRVRSSGGTAVPHGPGALQFSLVIPRVDRVGIEEVYRALCRPVQGVLSQRGWRAEFGHVAGAFCDGAHNLVVNGRKIAGTSQSWKGGLAVPGSRNRGYILAHGTLWVRVDPEQAADWLNDFYERTTGERPIRARSSTSLHLLPGGEGLDVRQVIAETANLLESTMGPQVKLERVRALTDEEISWGREGASETDPRRLAYGMDRP
ncbi:ligase [Kyrpidia spormannii]|uniref:Ligase n=1 Tax=Kyrpidia spormannii TaxID=2055160 RepID=A0A2K8N536_9BACL|nr:MULTISPECIES: lipoate--protein ligase family protein [Kyrpidia]ATY84433.1 ligase [Kyrpidia spormannii]MCL6575981.1 lipoate--protein ligase family protein [Kyrpidia sp.]